MLDDIRRELQEGKNQQKKLHEMIGEKEEEINEADDMVRKLQVILAPKTLDMQS